MTPPTESALPRICRWVMAALLACVLVACSSTGPQTPAPRAAHRDTGDLAWTPTDKAQWTLVRFPGKKNTTFRLVDHEKRAGIQADAHASVSMLRHTLHVPPAQLGTLQFAWQVPALIEGADMGSRHADDSPVRVVLAFEGDRSKFSTRDALLSELSQTLTGEPLPYATLMYVWCNHRPVGTVIANPRTPRIQKIVVESGPDQLKRWLEYERDLRTDFEQAFGEPPGALVAIGLMTDSDNTQSSTRAWYGDIRLKSLRAPAPE